MSSRLALREIEKKAWIRTFEHGMWDIGIGSLLLMFGLTIVIDFPAMSAIWVAALMPSMREVGRKVVVPRIGHVQFREPKNRAKGRLRGILTATMVLGVAFFAFIFWVLKGDAPSWAHWVSEHFILVIAFVWGGALAAAGWLVNFPRLYAYGALVCGSLVITDFLPGYQLGFSLLVVGGIILLAGLLLLLRFLRRYPRQDAVGPEESSDG